MDKKISELFDYGDEIVITDEISKMFDPEEIKEITMKKIHADENTPTQKTRNLSKGVTAAVIAAACLALCGAAYAAGLFRQNYNWNGEAVGEPHPVETVSPEGKVIDLRSQADAKTIQAILDDRADRELVVVHDAGEDSFSQRSESVASMAELQNKLEAEGSPLRAPYEIPDGYELTGGYVAYESTVGYTLSSSEVRSDGLVVDRFIAPPENDFISFYRMDYENEAGDRIFIFARMSDEAEYAFSAVTGENLEVVTIAGMDEALLHTSAESTTLSMLQYFNDPIDYVDPLTLEDNDDTDPFTEAYYMFNATNVDAEGLMQMLQP